MFTVSKACKFGETTSSRVEFHSFNLAICNMGHRFDWAYQSTLKRRSQIHYTATEFTTKWVEAIPMKSVTQDKIIAFLIENIITRFGVTQRLITDNGQILKVKT